MKRHTKAILTAIASIALLFALPSWADQVIKCDDFVFRLEKNFFSDDVIWYRKNGRWTPWCGGKYQRLEMGDDGGACIIDEDHVAQAKADKDRGVALNGFGLPVAQTIVIDFYLRTLNYSYGTLKMSCRSYNPS